jgi:hypothetical protein
MMMKFNTIWKYVKLFLFNLTMSLTSKWNTGINIHHTKDPNAICAVFVRQKQFPDKLKFTWIKPNKKYTSQSNYTDLTYCSIPVHQVSAKYKYTGALNTHISCLTLSMLWKPHLCQICKLQYIYTDYSVILWLKEDKF